MRFQNFAFRTPPLSSFLLGLIALGGAGAVTAAPPEARILETRVISHEPEYYHGWATVTRRENGDLFLVYSGGRDWHVCPFGRVDLMVSHDEGKSWSWRRTIMDTDIDDRDAGVVETRRGSLIVTTFTSVAFEKYIAAADAGQPNTRKGADGKKENVITPERLPHWKAARDRISAEKRASSVGAWTLRSTDGGVNWSLPARAPVNSPHGPIALKNGRLLYLGREMGVKTERIAACESRDDGLSWKWLNEIPTREGDLASEYHELHGVEAADGTIVCHIRNHNKTNAGETLQCESKDGGKTWTQPRAIGVWGLPSHLLRLKDDRLVMSYGHRRAPFGNQARVSSDHGKTWSEPIMLSPDSITSDLGYPSTVQLADGSLLSVWYEAVPGIDNAVLRQAHWTLSSR